MKESKSAVQALITGVCLIITVSIIMFGVNSIVNEYVRFKRTSSGGISVTGSSYRDFKSDSATWSCYYSVKGETTKEAYEIVKINSDKIKKYLLDNNFKEEDISFSNVRIQQDFTYEYNDKGSIIAEYPDGFTLTQQVNLHSFDVDLIDFISRDATSLIDEGIDLNSESPEYYYTKLDELKLVMIEEATQNARDRIDRIALNAQSKVDKLLNANLGVFQITGYNSSSEEFSYSGAYNTYSKFKTASVTVKLYYAIE